MYVSAFIIVLFCVVPCYGQSRQRKLNKLQIRVADLDDQTVDLRVDIDALRLHLDDLQSWREATETGVNTFKGSRLQGSIKQTLDTMERRVVYIMKGMEGEKRVIRQMMEDIRAEVRHDITKIQTRVDTATEALSVKQLDAFSNITGRLEMADTRITTVMEICETRFKKERKKMEKAFDAKLNQHMLTIETKDTKIIEQLNQISKQLETSRENYEEDPGQLEDISSRRETTTKSNDDILEQLNHLSKQGSILVKDDTGIVMHRDYQYYTRMKQDGWLQFKNYIYKEFRQRVDFDTAVKRCEDQDASLVELTDQEKVEFIGVNYGISFYWVGATDRQIEGEWRWLSGQLMEDDNWASGQPSGVRGMVEDCLLFSGYQSKYYGADCLKNVQFYICERQ